jgi:hypothetical protein
MTQTIDWLVQAYMPFFRIYGMTEENVRDTFEEWKQQSKNDSVKDYLWYVFQQMLQIIPTQVSPDTEAYHDLIKAVYKQMWEFLVRVENKAGNHIKKQMHYHELELWKIQSRYKQVVEIISGQCCPYCDSLNGKTFSFDEILKLQPLASKQCTRKWGCNCCYVVIGVRDVEGRLIMD